jgi:hypothetical protein
MVIENYRVDNKAESGIVQLSLWKRGICLKRYRPYCLNKML